MDITLRRQTQQYTFNLQYASIGVGLLVGTNDNSTKITWNIDGTLGNFTSTSTGGVASTSTEAVNGAQSGKITFNMIWIMAIVWFLGSHQ